jgi:GMP synthase (glutamine-hydrolysing)
VHAFVVQHVPFEGPAMIEPALRTAGADVHVVRADLGQQLPDAGDVDVFVVMGGPMGALDDTEHPHLADERALLRACVEADVPVLGVCLGAQLLAAALGARVFTGPAPEIGLGTVTLTEAGAADPVLGAGASSETATAPVPVLHWHGDTFDLPVDAQLLAWSRAYAHQAFRVERAYGLQFHVEMDTAAFVAVTPHLPGVDLDATACAEVEVAGRRVLSAWAATLDR